MVGYHRANTSAILGLFLAGIGDLDAEQKLGGSAEALPH
jgi:hypothetical protein